MIRSEQHPRTAPIYAERCPVHSQVVAFDGDHRLLGTCEGCMTQVAAGLAWMRDNPYQISDALLAQTRGN